MKPIIRSKEPKLRNPSLRQPTKLPNHPEYVYKVWSPTMEQDESIAEVVTVPWKPGEQELNSIAYRFAESNLEAFNIITLMDIVVLHLESKKTKTFHAIRKMVPEVHLVDEEETKPCSG